jgi:hypothetical protein
MEAALSSSLIDCGDLDVSAMGRLQRYTTLFSCEENMEWKVHHAFLFDGHVLFLRKMIRCYMYEVFLSISLADELIQVEKYPGKLVPFPSKEKPISYLIGYTSPKNCQNPFLSVQAATTILLAA